MLRPLSKVTNLETMMGWNSEQKSINTIRYMLLWVGWEWRCPPPTCLCNIETDGDPVLEKLWCEPKPATDLQIGVMQQRGNHSASKVKSGKVSCSSELLILKKKKNESSISSCDLSGNDPIITEPEEHERLHKGLIYKWIKELNEKWNN